MKHFVIFILLFSCWSILVAGQQRDSLPGKIQERHLKKVEKKYEDLERKLLKKSNRYLAKMQSREKKLMQKARKLSLTATLDLREADSAWSLIRKRLAQTSQSSGLNTEKIHLQDYSSFVDTLTTSLCFLQKMDGLRNKVKLTSEALGRLKAGMNETAEIQEFIGQRKKQLREMLNSQAKVPANLKRQLREFNKAAYYYSAQVKEYKELLNHPAKAEEKVIGLLRANPEFNRFMQENSRLASFFSLPGNAGSTQSLSGLQTRASVEGMIQDRIASGGANAMAQVQQNISAAYAEMDELKDKLNQLAEGHGDPEMPDFRPNSQKTKSFFRRMEYGFDVDFGKIHSLMPATAKMAASIGYKLHDNAAMGIGMGYQLGLGRIERIQISHQGVNMRSYLDWKIPAGKSKHSLLKDLWISGGYEMNYNAGFKHIEQLKDYNAWQRSALLGISKKYKISAKVKGEMKLLYDFLHREHQPVSNAFVWRLGYKF